MRVILFKSVDNLGSAGDVVDVKRGYYRNYLGPRGFAKEASTANLALMDSRRKKIDAMVARERAAAGNAAESLNGTELVFELRANDRGQLFGSVTTSDVAKALAAQGHDIDRRKIELSEHIKSLGSSSVRIRLYPEVYAEVTVTVKRLFTPEELEAIEADKEAEEARLAKAAAAAEEYRDEEAGEGEYSEDAGDDEESDS